MESFINSLGAGEIDFATGAVWLIVAGVVSACGGALGGLKVGGKEVGLSLSAMMGALFGPLAALPGVFLALLVLKFI